MDFCNPYVSSCCFTPIIMKNYPTWLSCGISTLCAITAYAAVEVPTYKVDGSFAAGGLKATPVSIAVDPQDQIYVLLKNGTVATYDSSGKSAAEFASKMDPPPTAMTVANGKIYLLSTKSKDEEVEFQGKKVKRKTACGANCGVFTPTGTKESEFVLPDVSSATAAHFIGNQLAVGDYKKSQIAFFNITSEKATAAKKIEGEFRLCCGIFDFCPTADGESMFVANLGAFKVQTYTNRKKHAEFGVRGEKLEDFHGCCNPVNVAALGTGFIVTVEKAPTRVKICDRKGKDAKLIEGLGELVNGCSTIPVAVDSKGAIYLASASKGCLIKCVSDAPPAGIPAAATTSNATTSNAASSKIVPAGLSVERTWKDAQSGNQVTGKLIAFDGTAATSSIVRDGKIRLQVGQKSFDLPLARLSQSDQDFVANLRSKQTAQNTP